MALTRQSLEDLYQAGKEYDVSPTGDGSAMVYMRKLGPTQQGNAVRKANAARITTQMQMDNPDDLYMIGILRDIAALDRDQKIEQLAMSSIAEERQKVEQQISEEEEWLEDGTLQSLVDAWEGGLLEEYLKGEGVRSDESQRVFDQMKAFTDKVDAKLQTKLAAARHELNQYSDEKIDKKMLKAQVEYDASMAWMRTFRMYQIFYGAHDQDRKQLFSSVEEVESLPAELFGKFIEAVVDLTLPSVEVKS